MRECQQKCEIRNVKSQQIHAELKYLPSQSRTRSMFTEHDSEMRLTPTKKMNNDNLRTHYHRERDRKRG